MKTMTLGEHLEELRIRLIISLIACILGSTVFFVARETAIGLAMRPYLKAWSWLAQDWMDDLEKAKAEGDLTPRQLANHEWVFGRINPETGKREGGAREELFEYDFGERHKGIKDGELRAHGFPYPRQLQQLGPVEFVVAWMKLAIIFGLFISAPIVFHQMWRFIGAGLYAAERRKIMRCLPFTILLFAAGVSFGYFIMIPYAVYFLTQLTPSDYIQQGYAIREYIGFFFTVILALGCVFQLPVVLVGLARFGIMSARAIREKRKFFILGAFIVGALLTPPDPITQLLMASPILLLFELGVFLAGRMEKKQNPPAAAGGEG